MTWFVVIAAAMAAIALAWVLPVLLRSRGAVAAVQSNASNIAIIKDQLTELEGDLAAGTLSQQQYQHAREDLERRAIEETHGAVAPVAAAPARARRTAAALAISIPLCAAGLYWQFGTPEGISPAPGMQGAGGATQHEIDGMVAKLASRLEQSPDDGNGWALLGRSYMVMQRPAQAIAAYERAVRILNDNADVLADYADALAMAQGRIEGKPLQIIERALKIDPTQWKALALAGSAAFERKDYKTAIGYWQTLQSHAEPGSEMARETTANIEEARQLGGINELPKAPTAVKSPAKAPLQTAQAKPQTSKTNAAVEGSVSLSPKLAGKAAPTDTVFVFARAAEGPRMPLAILRFQVKDLPVKFHLDDSLAMSPAMKLSNFQDVIIGARISKSANAVPQSGDLQGSSKPLKVGAAGVSVLIDQIVP